MKTTKIQNLKNYLINRCKDNKENYNYSEDINTFEDAKIMIKNIYQVEKPSQKDNKNTFIDWLQGLCFCSPIIEDLTPFTRCKNAFSQEMDVCQKIYQLIFNGGF